MGLNLALWIGGVVLIVAAALGIRAPMARLRTLQAAQENAERYDAWRGGRHARGHDETTGADVMREQLRARLVRWLIVAGVGVVLVIAGFAIR